MRCPRLFRGRQDKNRHGEAIRDAEISDSQPCPAYRRRWRRQSSKCSPSRVTLSAGMVVHFTRITGGRADDLRQPSNSGRILATPSFCDTQLFPTCLMKNLSVSRLPNRVLRKISRQITNPARLRRDVGDLIGVCEPLIARKTLFWTSKAMHFIPVLGRTVVHSVVD